MRKTANSKLKIWEAALLLAFGFTLCAGLWAQGQQRSLSEKLIRLHVLAASDSAADQAEKLQVRDAVLTLVEPLLAGADTAAEAQQILSGSLEAVEAVAQAAAPGRNIDVTLSREHYPTRDYTGFSLPAGIYTSLRISIDGGQGQNWWCVVFPPLCAETTGLSDAAQASLTQEDVALITEENEGYVLKFRFLEWWDALRSLFD